MRALVLALFLVALPVHAGVRCSTGATCLDTTGISSPITTDPVSATGVWTFNNAANTAVTFSDGANLGTGLVVGATGTAQFTTAGFCLDCLKIRDDGEDHLITLSTTRDATAARTWRIDMGDADRNVFLDQSTGTTSSPTFAALTVTGTTTPTGRLTLPMGEISYFSTTGTGVTISGTSDGSTNMVKAAPTTTLNNDMEFDNGGANDGRLRYTGSVTKTFHVACTFSLTPATNNDNFVVGIAKNGTVVAASKVIMRPGTTADTDSTAMQVMVSLATNEYLEIYIGNLTGARNATLKTLNLFAMGM